MSDEQSESKAMDSATTAGSMAVSTDRSAADASVTSPRVAGVGEGTPWKSRTAVIVLVLVTVLGLGADLGSKWLAFRYVAPSPQVLVREEVLASRNLSRLLTPHEPRTIVAGLLEFTLVLNPGAVFGMGAGKRVVFIVFTLGALGFGLWMFGAWTQRRDRCAHVAIGLLLAGGLGNLYDRLRFACVRDFIHPLPGVKLPFGWRNPLDGSDEVWPYVSNVADLFLLIGIGMLMVFLWRGGRHADDSNTRKADPIADA